MPDDRALSAYIDRLQTVAEAQSRDEPSARAAGVLFVAIGPDGRKRVWILLTAGQLPANAHERWEQALSAVSGVATPGYFLFGLAFGVGGVTPYEADSVPPIPPEWSAQIPPEGTMLDDAFIGRVWPAGG